jgi:galactose oxidase
MPPRWTSRLTRGVRLVWLILAALMTITSPGLLAQDSVKGKWEPVFDWPNVAIHMHMLPTGKVLFWSRREWDKTKPLEGLNPRDCTPRLWDPSTGTFTSLPKPGFNLFCSGHTFLADGRLLVAGGHIVDSAGESRATIFNPENNTWAEYDNMKRGRWYPTVVTLPDGKSVLVSSGSDAFKVVNDVQQIGNVEPGGKWKSIVDFQGLPLYPRMHVAPDGRVFMTGWFRSDTPRQFEGAFLLDIAANNWTGLDAPHTGPLRDYFPSVMYDVGKVLIVGGGKPPLKTSETIDLNATSPKWVPAGDMSIERRHHNATILPDGTVLVTGGTSGNGGGGNDPFNDESKPVKTAELWNPGTRKWTVLAAESIPRLYHSTAILLPDARVLSAGGGEYQINGVANPNDRSHRDGQIFSPPYLFKSTLAKPRPDITSAPKDVTYGRPFEVGTSLPAQVSRVSLVRLSSVTHAFNQNQRIHFLTPTVSGGKLQLTAPSGPNVCPPGHYMMFVLNADNVPSVASIIRIHD